MDELQKQLAALQAELKSYLDKAKEQQEKTGSLTTELKGQIEALQKQVDAMDQKMAERHAASQSEESLEESFKKNDAVQRLLRDKSGSAVIELDAKQVRQF